MGNHYRLPDELAAAYPQAGGAPLPPGAIP
jgi:hypothetical protein